MSGFTIVEMLAAMAILMIIMGMIFGLTQQASNAWRGSSAKIESNQGARAAFDMITETLGQATLNTYYDYTDSSGNGRTPGDTSFIPSTYGRFSDLHFISGKSLIPSQISHSVFFQTPAGYSDTTAFQGMDTLLNACGFYIRFDKDSSRPAFLDSKPLPTPDRYRYRLYQFLQPSENLSVFSSKTGQDWFQTLVGSGGNVSSQIADNIIALAILPKASDQDGGATLADNYEYDSRNKANSVTYNQLPPLVEVVMVAIDEPSAKRLESGSSAPDLGVAGLFGSAASLEADLKKLENGLTSKHVTYRVYRTTVSLRNSKWSSQ